MYWEMDNQSAQHTAELKSLLKELAKQLLDASIYLDIWEQLWPTEQVVGVINRYKGFFGPARQAILDQFFIKMCNIISNDRRSPSFYNVFKILGTNPNLAPNIDVQSLRRRLKQHKATIRAIDNYRNTRAAHWDIDVAAEQKPVLYGKSKDMLKEMQDVFNEISRASTNNVWSFKIIQHADTTALLNHLDELMTVHKKRIGELDSMAES
jgi:hypothetical protein